MLKEQSTIFTSQHHYLVRDSSAQCNTLAHHVQYYRRNPAKSTKCLPILKLNPPIIYAYTTYVTSQAKAGIRHSLGL